MRNRLFHSNKNGKITYKNKKNLRSDRWGSEKIYWEGMDWEGMDWEEMDWEEMDWEGMDWEGKNNQKLATFFSPWRSICHQIQHLHRTRDRIFGPVVRKIVLGGIGATRGPKFKNILENMGSKKWGPDPNPGFF